MKHVVYFLIFFFFSFVSTAEPISQAHLPPSFIASYDLIKNGLPVAETQYRFEKTDNSADFSSTTELTGIAAWFSEDKASERSLLEITEKQIQVKHFQYQQSGKEELTIKSQFDQTSQQVTTRINQHAEVITSFTSPTWDKLSMLLALVSHASVSETSLEIDTLDKTEIRQYLVTHTGEQEIELDEDNWVKTMRWQRVNKNRKTVFYLDPAQHFIPVKIEQYKRDKRRATLLLKEIQWL